jgi:2'-5' RNA ligase
MPVAGSLPGASWPGMVAPSYERSNRVIVAFPRLADDADARRIAAVRRRFDPLAAEIPPHLTLVFPFEDPISEAELERHVRGALGGVRSFPVVLADITAHESEYLFLNVKRGNDALIQLHDVLYGGPLAAHRLRTHTFVPHLTVGRVPPSDLGAALDATAELAAAIPATVDTISVYRVERDGTRGVVLEVPLIAGVLPAGSPVTGRT